MATIVALHAHPDDEALLTGGWLAQRAAGGDRVVLVFATDGAAGLSAREYAEDLAARRRSEGEASAAALGVARVVWLGYADSGMADAPTSVPGRFVDVPLEEAARAVAAVLDEEDAEILTGYDSRGGYGHPDHVRVHEVARAAREVARRRPRLLEATMDRSWLVRLVRLARPVERWLPGITLPSTDIFCDPAEIGLRVDVRDQVDAKRAALRAHASQAGGGIRTVALLLALPRPIAARVIGTEYFLEAP